jgi:mRNA-degrading endonuclease RelE of RelBE toxin-antitoxin system
LEGVTIHTHKSYLRALKRISKADQTNINAAIAELAGIIGNPHQHSGAGVRRLHPGVFEIRVDVRLRVMFTVQAGNVFLHPAGDHDQVQDWLRNNL